MINVTSIVEEDKNKYYINNYNHLLGKTKEEVITYLHLNESHLIVKFIDENPYLVENNYEFFDVLILVKNNIVKEITKY